MPWVKTDKDNLNAICLAEMEGQADFSDNNLAQVSQHDLDVLTDKYPDRFEEHETEDTDD